MESPSVLIRSTSFRLHADRNPRRFVHQSIFLLVAWILQFMFRSHLHVIFPAFSHIISAYLIMQTKFIFQQIKFHVQKSENQAPQNYQSMFTEVTSFEEVKLSYTRASKFQPLA